MSGPLRAAVRRQLTPAIRAGTLVVAVSGGPDSLCLLHALHGLGLRLHAFHLDHGLRGAESAADAAFVAETAAAWGIPATVVRAEIGAAAGNTYQAGRAARYSALAQLAAQIGASAVAVAHTADDQAETVLIHLLRGAGVAGLRGMRPLVPWAEWRSFGTASALPAAGPPLIRPLLGTSRSAVERYCTSHGLVPRRDPSNADVTHTRSRVRHELLPLLRDYNPQVDVALSRTAQLLADEHDFLSQALAAVWPSLVKAEDDAIVLDRRGWLALHPALRRAAIRQAHAALAPGEPLSAERVEAACGLLLRGGSGTIELPGPVRLVLAQGSASMTG